MPELSILNEIQCHRTTEAFLFLGERLYLFSSMHQGCGAILLSPIYPHALLDQQPEDVVLPPGCCQHAQGHAADILWTNREIQSHNVTDERDKMTCYSLDLLWIVNMQFVLYYS